MKNDKKNEPNMENVMLAKQDINQYDKSYQLALKTGER